MNTITTRQVTTSHQKIKEGEKKITKLLIPLEKFGQPEKKESKGKKTKEDYLRGAYWRMV